MSQPGSELADMLVQDIDGDGIPDLTLLQIGLQTTGNTGPGVLTFLGKGDGTFQAPAFVYSGNPGTSAIYADFNNDGLPDLAISLGTSGEFNVNGAAVFANLGKGSFSAPLQLPAPLTLTPPYGSLAADEQVFAGDFNGDGAPDVLVGLGNGYVPGVLFLNQAGTSLQLVAGASTLTQYDPIPFTVLASSVASTQPTGSVSFYANGASLGSAQLSGGTASFTTATLPAGTDSVVAKYSGSTSNYPSTSNTTVVTVTALAPDFSISAAATSLSITSSAPASTTLTLTANQSFAGSVRFACENLPAGVTCTFSPASVSLQASGMSNAQLSIAYSNQGSNRSDMHRHTHGEAVAALCGLCLMGGMLGTKRRKSLALLMLMTIAMATAGVTGCSNSPTPKAAFTANIMVVATNTTGSSHSVPLQLTIQP